MIDFLAIFFLVALLVFASGSLVVGIVNLIDEMKWFVKLGRARERAISDAKNANRVTEAK